MRRRPSKVGQAAASRGLLHKQVTLGSLAEDFNPSRPEAAECSSFAITRNAGIED